VKNVAKKSKEIKPDIFEWTCTKCNYLHVEIIAPKNRKDNTIKLECKQCGDIRHITLVDVPESALAGNWLSEKCHQCTEREECLSKDNRKIHNKRVHLISKLGFCEDYIVDSSQLQTDKRQVCHEEVTFDDLFNKGIFPINPEDEAELK